MLLLSGTSGKRWRNFGQIKVIGKEGVSSRNDKRSRLCLQFPRSGALGSKRVPGEDFSGNGKNLN